MTTGAERKSYRLMIVDDEPIVGKRLQQVFGKMGLEVETLTNAAPALDAMAARPFDVVVTDLKMEGIDGMEVLARVRKTNPETRVIIITGFAEQQTAQEAFKQGVFDFIAKPFRLDDLKRVILEALDLEAEPVTAADPEA